MTKLLETQLGEVRVVLHALTAAADNYIYVLVWDKKALIIDPCEAGSIREFIEHEGLELSTILITHGHSDHIGGLREVQKRYNSYVIASEKQRVEGIDQPVGDSEELLTGPFQIETLSTPGHCPDHICYYFKNLGLLFSGDTLFGAGCGRLIEGSAEEQFHSLQKLAALPLETRICFGHEYTVKNLEFAQTVGGGDEKTLERLNKERQKREGGLPTTPSTLEIELLTNPFLKTKDPQIRTHLGLEEAQELEVFTQLRQLRDRF